MGLSLYYEARRGRPIDPGERTAIDAIQSRHSVEDQIAERERTGLGPNWESFCVYDPAQPSEPDVIFEGATRLPDNSEDDVWIGLKHWCHVLTLVRHVLHDATWSVHVDDHDIVWDATQSAYNPSQ